MAFNLSPEPPLLLADGHLDEDMMGGQTEASEVDSMEDTLHQMSMFRDYVPAQKRLMDRMNHILGEQHLKNWYIAKYLLSSYMWTRPQTQNYCSLYSNFSV
jgi:hypothetical protein